MSRGMRSAVRWCLAAAVVAAAGAAAAWAAEVRAFQIQTQGAFLAGTLDGISVDPLGRLRLADRVERLTSIEEPFLFAAAAHPDGWVVGTGNAGRVLLVDRSGGAREIFAAPEPEIFAVWADPDGTVFAGSSPSGKVYRIPAGAETPPAPEEALFYDPGETYIWALARDAAGRLLVATGTEGRLHRVAGDGPGDEAVGEVVYDSDDTHLRSLLVRPGGEVIIGTAGEGLVQRLSERGGALVARTLHDSAAPEVVALTAGPDGRLWAAVAASEASLVDLSRPARARGRSGGGSGGQDQADEDDDDENGGEDDESGTVVVIDGATGTIASGSRTAASSGPRSRLIAIDPAGRVESVWSFDKETVFALFWQRGRLWIGTGLEGKLYSWDGSQLVLEKDVDEGQVVALAQGDPGPVFATTNAAALYRVGGGLEGAGTYTSAPLDAGQVAQFGTFRWRGELPPGAGLELSFRSGVSAEPDRTWSEWTGWRRGDGDGARQGGEVSLDGLDPGRYIQWRARMKAGGGESPRLYGVELSYRQENLRPRVARFRVLDPGEILVPASFNPANQVYEPASPNRQGIFTSLEPADEDGRLKTLWKKGHRSLRWSVEDDNGDDLRYRLAFRPEGAAAAGDGGWLPIADDLEDDHFGFDSTALPDGVYRFRLEATDAPDNVNGTALVAERISEPVVVDNSPPERRSVDRRGGDGGVTLTATVEDTWNPLRNAEYSVDAGEWRPAEPADGLLDGRREELVLEVPAGAKLVLLRVEDAAFNTATFDLSGEMR